nr:uncharacterized protein LOC109169324 [Ipomoea batatas]
MIFDFGEEKVAFNVLEDPNSRVIERCYRVDVMGSKTRDGDSNFAHMEKVEKGCLLGHKACVGTSMRLVMALLKMAPKTRNLKRNRGESSRQPQEQPRAAQYETFNTRRARDRYETCISKRPIKPERGIEIVAPDAWNWGTSFLAQPDDAFDSIVREFYANAKDGVETLQCIVRGCIGRFFFYNYQRLLWAIIDFIRAKLIPNSHRGNVKRDLVFLTYCIKEQRTIDIGRLISQSICEIAQTETKSRCFLGHPSLITELCRLAGVPIMENQEVRLPPQLYLSQHHIQTRYGQVQVPVPDPEDAENEDQAHDEAMEDPAPAAHAPDQFPPPYNMEQFFARQMEFMRRQEDFMTRHEGYMRRSDDIKWFVGTSAHQHNLAAQGFTPQFPPPPPWLQDP